MGTLSKEDAKLFFKLWLPLLRYTSDALDIYAGRLLTPVGAFNYQAGQAVSEAIWADTTIIDDYLAVRTGLTDEEQDIVLSWKRSKYGQFVVERHLQKGSILLSTEDQSVYLVKGITEPWPVLLRQRPLPATLKTALMPFRDAIVINGIIEVSQVTFGSSYKSSFKEQYMEAKRGGRIIRTL